MKKIISLALLLGLCSITTVSNAYEYSFFNNTTEPIGIAIQYTGNDSAEPLYKHLVKPQSMISFTPGKENIPSIKWGFCLDNIYFIENPTPEQRAHNFEKSIWKKIPITWTEEKSTTKENNKKKTKETTPAQIKSLCKDRHFDITRDKYKKIVITSSLQD